jgi:hypothetical protein
MLDNPLITLLIAAITAGEVAAGIEGLPIAQAFQPTQEGVPTEPSAFLHKVFDHPLGMPERSDVWDSEAETIAHTETQRYETTFQISTLATQDPNAVDSQTQYTASDILNLVRYILQNSTTIATLQAQNVGILKIDQVRNTPFVDDRGRHEFSPSLDFVIEHVQTITSVAPIVSNVEIQLDRV